LVPFKFLISGDNWELTWTGDVAGTIFLYTIKDVIIYQLEGHMSRRLDIEIETDDRDFSHELFETQSLSAGESQVSLADGSTVIYSGSAMRKAMNAPEVIRAVVEVALGVGTSVAGSWLYDKLKGKPAKLRINRKEVEITAESIRVVIEEIEREG
jgi:hypothetical protein